MNERERKRSTRRLSQAIRKAQTRGDRRSRVELADAAASVRRDVAGSKRYTPPKGARP